MAASASGALANASVMGLGLCAAAVVLLLAVGAVAFYQRGSRAAQPAPEASEPADHALRVAEARTLILRANQTRARAEQAVLAAEVARERYADAERSAQLAWQDYDVVSERYAAVRAETGERATSPNLPTGPQRQEVLHAAFAAYRRGDLSTEDLHRVWQTMAGHDPDADRLDHERSQLAAAARTALHAYERATAASKAAAADLRIAEVAESACLQEATRADQEAREAAEAIRARRRGPSGS